MSFFCRRRGPAWFGAAKRLFGQPRIDQTPVNGRCSSGYRHLPGPEQHGWTGPPAGKKTRTFIKVGRGGAFRLRGGNSRRLRSALGPGRPGTHRGRGGSFQERERGGCGPTSRRRGRPRFGAWSRNEAKLIGIADLPATASGLCLPVPGFGIGRRTGFASRMSGLTPQPPVSAGRRRPAGTRGGRRVSINIRTHGKERR